MSAAIKKVTVAQLQPGMYIHDLNCGWMDHPFLISQFRIKDEATIKKIGALGICELYIDTKKGTDVADAKTADEVQREIQQGLLDIVESEPPPIKAVELAEEAFRARKLHVAANKIVHGLLDDVRLGRQIEVDKLEPLVENMVESIFRCQDALLPMARLKNHDEYTFQHSVSVCALMVSFARNLKLPRDVIRDIGMGALLHDVGKSKVPGTILNKPGKLDEREFEIMKQHVVYSAQILGDTKGINEVAYEVAALHHERFDGTGYPNKLKGDEISLYGQMSAIVDVYDAITSIRVYHKGIPATEALGKIFEWSKFHFKPELVQAFVRAIGIYPTGSLVKLASGRLAVVLEQQGNNSMKPRVKVIYSTKQNAFISPEIVDLSKTADKIEGHESFTKWGIDPLQWLPH
jgi:putative nucleotidyltransferase with HDIG domain